MDEGQELIYVTAHDAKRSFTLGFDDAGIAQEFIDYITHMGLFAAKYRIISERMMIIWGTDDPKSLCPHRICPKNYQDKNNGCFLCWDEYVTEIAKKVMLEKKVKFAEVVENPNG